MRKCLLIIACLLLAGCAGTGDPGYPVNGHAADAASKVPVKPTADWEGHCWLKTQDQVRTKLLLPKTAQFEQAPTYDAYYDRGRNVTVLTVYGLVVSSGNYGQVYKQNFYVTWEQKGNLNNKTREELPEWELGDVVVFEHQL